MRVIWRRTKTIYLQFWWDPRVALLSFGAMLPTLPSWPQITFVSFLSFGPFVASGSVIAIVSMVSLNNQTSSHEKARSLTLTICFYTNAAPFFKNDKLNCKRGPSETSSNTAMVTSSDGIAFKWDTENSLRYF